MTDCPLKHNLHRALLSAAALALLALGATSCHDQDAGQVTYVVTRTVPSDSVSNPERLAPEPTDGVVHRMVTHIPNLPLRQIFCDSNSLQLTAARANGIVPITDVKSAYQLKVPIVLIESCSIYKIMPLHNSMPYLVPKAAQLLHDIGQAFQDTIKARGGKLYRMQVTSMLRTDYSVAQLQKHNLAATQESCHRYGTTFDVSWSKFDCMDPSYVINLGDLKNILGEVILNFRNQGRCYAIFEGRHACYHVTVR